MTWSIIARDSSTGRFGIAVATRFFAVGARVPHIAANVGGIATQALVNPYYGIDGVKLLREGKSPREVIDTMIASDAGQPAQRIPAIRTAVSPATSYAVDISTVHTKARRRSSTASSPTARSSRSSMAPRPRFKASSRRAVSSRRWVSALIACIWCATCAVSAAFEPPITPRGCWIG